MNHKNNAVVCFDVGGSFIKFGVSEEPGKITVLGKEKIPASSWSEFREIIKKVTYDYRAFFSDKSPVAVSTAGIVVPGSGKVFASNIPAFHERNLSKELSSFLNRKVIVNNDADCFTLAEATEGKGKGHKILFGAILGSGVGGGIVADGRIITGRNGLTGEWGHGPVTLTEIEVDGQPVKLPRLQCACGQKGCLDTYGGARGLEKLHSILHKEALSSIDIINKWLTHEPEALKTIKIWAEIVSQPLAYCINITGASIVVVGGGLASVSPLISELDKAVRKYVLGSNNQNLVVSGKYSQNGGMIGASLLARQSVLSEDPA